MKKIYKITSSLLKNERKRYLFLNNEICNLSFKLLLESNFSKKKIKRSLSILDSQLLNSSLTSINNICLFSGKNRSIYREFRLSRTSFRKLVDFGLLTGIKRSS
jgi:ribosomal protein S14